MLYVYLKENVKVVDITISKTKLYKKGFGHRKALEGSNSFPSTSSMLLKLLQEAQALALLVLNKTDGTLAPDLRWKHSFMVLSPLFVPRFHPHSLLERVFKVNPWNLSISLSQCSSPKFIPRDHPKSFAQDFASSVCPWWLPLTLFHVCSGMMLSCVGGHYAGVNIL